MDRMFKNFLKMLKTNESAISQAMGALVVVLVGVLLFNYFKDNKSTPEITTEAEQTIATSENVELTTDDTGKYIPKGLPASHNVVKGESLWTISEKYYGNGYNWVDIASENKLANANSLNEGIVLTIPQAALRYDKDVKLALEAVGDDSLLSATSYTVVKGDHLWNIALRAYGDGYRWNDIYKANADKIRNANQIEIGMLLTLPR